ncbi:MAG: hypothetical protein K6G23_01595 [Lachnospiraceae bacterium]|nr:hypothetical protein [Lachnospiraceae bacterium]
MLVLENPTIAEMLRSQDHPTILKYQLASDGENMQKIEHEIKEETKQSCIR